jgi:hypothetical protein
MGLTHAWEAKEDLSLGDFGFPGLVSLGTDVRLLLDLPSAAAASCPLTCRHPAHKPSCA